MSASPFAFFRGGALIMAADIAPLPLSGITVQVCGDAHLVNFGLFASPERDLLFDINDFDETLAGAWEWDLMRLSASLVAGRPVAFVHAATRLAMPCWRPCAPTASGWRSTRACAPSTSTTRASTAAPSWSSPTSAPGPTCSRPSTPPPITTRSTSCRRSRPSRTAGGGSSTTRRIITHPEEMSPEVLAGALASYRDSLQEDRRVLLDRYQVVDAALKVVGVGSVGLGAYRGAPRGWLGR